MNQFSQPSNVSTQPKDPKLSQPPRDIENIPENTLVGIVI